MSDKNKKSESSWKLWVFAGVIFAAVLLIFGGFTWVILENFGSGEADLGSWANAGAAYGMLAALFTGLAFAGLIVTILLQREDLSLQREELKETRNVLDLQREELEKQSDTFSKQQFETTFFNLLGNFNNKVEEIVFFDKLRPGSPQMNKNISAYSYGEEALKKCLSRLPGVRVDRGGLYESEPEEVTLSKYDLYTGFGFRVGLDKSIKVLTSLIDLIKKYSENSSESNFYFKIIDANISNFYLLSIFYHSKFDYVTKSDLSLLSEAKIFDKLKEDNLSHYHVDGFDELFETNLDH